MSSNKVNDEAETFFTVNVHNDCHTAYIGLNLPMINKFLDLLLKFKKGIDLRFNKDNLLNFYSIDDYFSVEEICFKFKNVPGNNLVLNVTNNEKKVYVCCSEEGKNKLKESLFSLVLDLENNKPEDISYMIPEWGGRWLLNEQILENSSVICHLRLFGVV